MKVKKPEEKKSLHKTYRIEPTKYKKLEKILKKNKKTVAEFIRDSFDELIEDESKKVD